MFGIAINSQDKSWSNAEASTFFFLKGNGRKTIIDKVLIFFLNIVHFHNLHYTWACYIHSFCTLIMDWIQFYLQMECLKLALPCIQQFKNQYKSLGRALDATRHSLQVKNIHMSDDPREDLGKFKYFSNSDGWCGLCKNFMFCFLWSKCKYTVQTTKRIESPPCAWNDQLWHNGIYFLFHLRARRDSANFKRSWVVTFSFRFTSLASKTWELMACKDVRCS